jgi:hypothetical protein
MFTPEMQDLRATKEKERQQAIDKLIEKSKESGGVTDRTYWKMVYDFELAPKTTNRKQLLELDIAMPPLDEVADPGERVEILQLVLKGLAAHSIFVLGHEHLGNDDFYKTIYKCLDEECREVPNEPGVREYIQLTGVSSPEVVDQQRDWVPVAPAYKDTR